MHRVTQSDRSAPAARTRTSRPSMDLETILRNEVDLKALTETL